MRLPVPSKLRRDYVKKVLIVTASLVAFMTAASAADLPQRQPVPYAPAPIGKMPIGKSPIGKAPLGKAPVTARY
jgi:opacity protein-like surface antigen